MTFARGDVVKWESQAGGHYREKVGVVVYVLKKDDDLYPNEIANSFFPDHRRMFDGRRIPGPASQEVGYLVEVKDGKTLKLYMPHPKQLVF